MIAILCPTYRRHKQCKRMVESVKGVAKVYLCTDSIDLFDYKQADIIVEDHVYGDPMLPTAYKWNVLAEEALKNSNNKLFMLGADDMIFETEGWDKALIDHYNALENKIHVYHLQDSRDPDGTPHPIFTREWIEFWGYMISPVYLHWFGDTWAKEVSKANDCFTHLREFTLRHEKPSDRGNGDDTHNRIRSWGWNERDRFVWENTKEHRELDIQNLAEQLGRC